MAVIFPELGDLNTTDQAISHWRTATRMKWRSTSCVLCDRHINECLISKIYHRVVLRLAEYKRQWTAPYGNGDKETRLIRRMSTWNFHDSIQIRRLFEQNDETDQDKLMNRIKAKEEEEVGTKNESPRKK